MVKRATFHQIIQGLSGLLLLQAGFTIYRCHQRRTRIAQIILGLSKYNLNTTQLFTFHYYFAI